MNRGIFLFLVLFLFGSSTLYSQTPSLEEIQVQVEAGELISAQEALTAYIAENPRDFAAKRLEREIEGKINAQEAALLTDEALFYLEDGDFDNAYLTLEKAVRLDPNNGTAVALFANLSDVVDVEALSAREEAAEEAAEQAIAQADISNQNTNQTGNQTTSTRTNTENTNTGNATTGTENTSAASNNQNQQNNNVQETGNTTVSNNTEQAVMEDVGPSFDFGNLLSGENTLGLSLPLSVLLAGTDSIPNLDTGLVQGGIGLGVSFSPALLGNLLKAEVAYDITLLTLGGDERVAYTLNEIFFRLSFDIRLLSVGEKRSLIVSPRLGYNYFDLSNSEAAGIYYFKQLYSPTFGLGISDPLLAHFMEADWVQDLVFHLGVDYSSIAAGSETITLWDFELLGVEYWLMDNLALSLSNRLSINTSETAFETFYRPGFLLKYQLF